MYIIWKDRYGSKSVTLINISIILCLLELTQIILSGIDLEYDVRKSARNTHARTHTQQCENMRGPYCNNEGSCREADDAVLVFTARKERWGREGSGKKREDCSPNTNRWLQKCIRTPIPTEFMLGSAEDTKPQNKRTLTHSLTVMGYMFFGYLQLLSWYGALKILATLSAHSEIPDSRGWLVKLAEFMSFQDFVQ